MLILKVLQRDSAKWFDIIGGVPKLIWRDKIREVPVYTPLYICLRENHLENLRKVRKYVCSTARTSGIYAY